MKAVLVLVVLVSVVFTGVSPQENEAKPWPCGATLTGSSDVIASPGYAAGENYPNNLDCDVIIHVEPGHEIQITFDDFELEEDGEDETGQRKGYCPYDYVQIFDGEKNDLGRFCGSSIPQLPPIDSDVVMIHFVTDDDYSHKGFAAKYQISAKTRDDNRQHPLINWLHSLFEKARSFGRMIANLFSGRK